MHSLVHRYRYFLENTCASIFRVEFSALKKERAFPSETYGLSAEFYGNANGNLPTYSMQRSPS